MELLTLQEVNQIFGLKDPKARYVRNLYKKGLITGAKFGRNLLIEKRSVDDFIAREIRLQNPKVKASSRMPLGDKFNSTRTCISIIAERNE